MNKLFIPPISNSKLRLPQNSILNYFKCALASSALPSAFSAIPFQELMWAAACSGWYFSPRLSGVFIDFSSYSKAS